MQSVRHTEQRTSDGPRGTAPERDPDRKDGGQRWGTNRGDEAASGFGQVVIRTLASGPGQPGERVGRWGADPGNRASDLASSGHLVAGNGGRELRRKVGEAGPGNRPGTIRPSGSAEPGNRGGGP